MDMKVLNPKHYLANRRKFLRKEKLWPFVDLLIFVIVKRNKWKGGIPSFKLFAAQFLVNLIRFKKSHDVR
jgi:3-methyladenine DNA glycosylase AlkD